ncbi:MAG: hypothetical protein ACR2MG_17460 [Pyrinomonadaceae bacterium]
MAAIGFFVYQNYFRRSETKTILANRVTPFSGATGRENTPAFSPDGKQIAFAWNGGEEDGDFDIYVRLVGAVEPLRLTDSEYTEQYPVFSPDGSQIAFVRDFGTHGEVILIPAFGGAERRIARLFSGNFSISFAPDGQTIAVIDTEDSIAGKPHAVYLVNLQSGERSRLTAPAEFVGETTPRFAPDGKTLAFVRVFDDKNQDLFVVPATGGKPRQITFDQAIIHSLAWSADGRKILFVSFRGGEQTNIWRVSAGGGQPELLATNGRNISNIAVSSDDKTVAFVENLKNTDIWLTAANGRTAKKLVASIYSEHDPIFSPDGSRIAFASNRTGKFAIWMSDADGKNLRLLADAPSVVGLPRFSPDGSQVVYNGIEDGNPDVYVVSVEGGAARRLTTNAARDFAPAWSADGAWIYFTSNRAGENQIWKMPASGEKAGEAVQITRSGAFQAMPAPDGKTVFYAKIGSPAEVWSVPAAGGAEQNLPEFAAAGFTGSWTVTRAGIYFLARNPDQSLKIRFYDFTDGKIKNISDEHGIPENIFDNFDATAGSSRFLYALLDQNASSIILAELGN